MLLCKVVICWQPVATRLVLLRYGRYIEWISHGCRDFKKLKTERESKPSSSSGRWWWRSLDESRLRTHAVLSWTRWIYAVEGGRQWQHAKPLQRAPFTP